MRLVAAFALASLAACAAPQREAPKDPPVARMDLQPLLLTSDHYIPPARAEDRSFHVELPRGSYLPPSWQEIERSRCARYVIVLETECHDQDHRRRR